MQLNLVIQFKSIPRDTIRSLNKVLENYQMSDGNVQIPQVLKKYFDNQNTLF